MGITEKLARFTVDIPNGRISDKARESAKLKFLDTIGISIAGARHPSTMISVEVARQMGGLPVASIIGHRDKTSSPLAGYINGVAAHALEYDDYTKSVTHASVCMVPGALALAEQYGASGRAMLDSFIVGFQVEAHIAKGLRPWLLDRGWHPNGILGAFGIAAAGARMIGLDQLKTRMAFGLAASQGSGVRKNVGSMGKAFHVGHGVRCGVFSVLLAAKGFKVDPDVIEGVEDGVEGHDRFGMADTFNGVGQYDLAKMEAGLGEVWELEQNTTNVRLHPGSTAPGSSIDAMLDLAREHNLQAEQIERIELEVTPQCLAIAPYTTADDSHKARFCLAYDMAVALIDKTAGLQQYTDERVNKPDVQTLMKRVQVTVPDDLKKHWGQWGQDGVNWGEMRLAIQLKDGRRLARARSYARGWTEDPATWDDLCEKYRDCAAGILPKSQVDESIAMIRELETLPKVSTLMAVLQPGGGRKATAKKKATGKPAAKKAPSRKPVAKKKAGTTKKAAKKSPRKAAAKKTAKRRR